MDDPDSYELLPEAFLSHTGAYEEYKAEWQATLYRVGGKMFAIFHEDKEGNPYLSFKSVRAEMAELYDRYEGIIPGFHFNKQHWSSVRMDLDVPPELIARLVNRSYELVRELLPKRIQRELEMADCQGDSGECPASRHG